MTARGPASTVGAGPTLCTVTVDPNQHDVFVLRQRFTPVVNRYEFFLPDGDAPGEPICFVEQRRFTFKEDIRFYRDSGKSHELLRIKARQRFDPRATYDVTDETGAVIGQIQKVFGMSLVRSTYRVTDAAGAELMTSTEKSLPIALVRRIVDFIPFVELVSEWLPIPYHFLMQRGDRVLGENRRQIGRLRDTYTIDMCADPERTVDRRLVLALAVGQDALQAR